MIRCVTDWLENAANRTPEATAFDAPSEKLNYSKLRIRAKQIGSAIAAATAAQSPVLILMEKRPMCICAMLGCAYAGCFYTPLDSSMPKKRMALIVETLQPKVILCEKKHAETAQMLGKNAVILNIEEIPETVNEPLLDGRRRNHVDTDLLYVLFTSGSTGVPKGVAIMHRSVIDFVEWACNALNLPQGVRFGSQAPFYFDNSVLDIYCAIRMSGSVFLIPGSDFMFPKRLMATLVQQKIDTIFWVPSALTAAAEGLSAETLPDLKRIFFCGEVMPCRTLNRWREVFPNADYVNMYGPTEITDVCTWYRVDRAFSDTDSLPIGFPCENTRIELLDGEICVGGTCLSPGYYNAPEKTEKVFTQNPLRPQIREILYHTGDLGEYNAQGELMFLGRRDHQIKRSGYRIELGEIECALQAVEGVTLGCCYYDSEKSQIVAAYTGAVEEKAVRSALRTAVPKYMLPDVLLKRETLPRTGSGKIDRLALRQEVEREHPVV